MRILLVEDSERLGKALREGLRRNQHAVDRVSDGQQALVYARHADYDVVVLDLMLPKIDGLTVLRELRRSGHQASVLILSAKDTVQDRIHGLHAGADDYLVKPFSFDELLARIAAIARRGRAQRDPVLKLGCIEFDSARRLALAAGSALNLTPHELVILECLSLNRGRVVTRQRLEAYLYDADTTVSSNVVEAHVSTLRRKLRAAGAADLIKTRRGAGYIIEDA